MGKIPSFEMDDDWGYPDDELRKPPNPHGGPIERQRLHPAVAQDFHVHGTVAAAVLRATLAGLTWIVTLVDLWLRNSYV